MENFPVCPQCFCENKRFDMSPFCSDRCEILTHDWAPIPSIHKIYDDYKKSKESKETTFASYDSDDIDTVLCRSCDKEIDYNFLNKQVEYFCSTNCVDHFVQSVDFTDSHIVYNTMVFNMDNRD
jgi:endogenous inhibitor of DNA gyrase (YacG/DUF329 family)